MSSIKEQIIARIKTNLDGIAGIGFVSDGELTLPENLSPDQFPAVFVTDQDENKTWADESSTDVILNLIITGYTRSNSDEDSAQTKRRQLELDVEKAIMADWQINGLAIDTIITKILTDLGTFPNYGITDITVQVRFYHDRGEPDSQANSPVP